MKQRWLALVLVAPAILMADAKPPAVCLRSLPLISVHALSVTADAVATTRHRAATPPGGAAPAGGFPPAVNFIDTDLFAAMRKDHVVPTQVASDEEFLRRVTLDLTGQIPDAVTVQAFLADTSP